MPPDTVVTNLHIIMSRTERKYRFLKKFDERFAMRSQNVWGMGRCGKWHPELRTVKSWHLRPSAECRASRTEQTRPEFSVRGSVGGRGEELESLSSRSSPSYLWEWLVPEKDLRFELLLTSSGSQTRLLTKTTSLFEKMIPGSSCWPPFSFTCVWWMSIYLALDTDLNLIKRICEVFTMYPVNGWMHKPLK